MLKLHENSYLAKITRPILRPKKRPGAPKGNRNARSHGWYSAEGAARRAEIRALIAETEELAREIERGLA